MVELVDTLALEANAQYGRVGASPTKCTLITRIRTCVQCTLNV